jgi:hypothetical protein
MMTETMMTDVEELQNHRQAISVARQMASH